MEQQRGGGMEEMKGLTQQDRRGGGVQVKPNQENPQPAQPQKCPRCDSLNTKFCYYNNYSSSQPRYFCKTCRRYWTQGGTLRNVPVGGGCRKGKRSKKPSSSSSSAAAPPDHQNLMMNNLLLQDQNQNQEIPNLTTTITEAPPINSSVPPSLIPSSMAVGSSNPPPLYYPSGGFLSSLAAFQSFNQPPPIAVNPGGDFGVSNLALLQGFSLPSFIPPPQLHHHHHQIHQQSQIQNMGIREKAVINQVLPLDVNMNQPNRSSISQQQEWPARSFTNNSTSEAAGFWSSSSSSSSTTGSTALNPTHHHWSDHVPGFGGPPTSSSSPHPPPPSLL